MTSFHYTPAITAAFPSVIGGIAIGTVENSSTPDDLKALYEREQQEVRERIGETPLSDLASLAAWRNAFRKFNVDPTKYRSATEALLRRLTKKGDIPSLNTLVDIGNMISIRYGLPVAILDVRHLEGETLSVQFATGNESFQPLGEDHPENPEEGEVIFADVANNVYARRWCWRQSLDSAAQIDTTRVIVTIEAHHENGQQDVSAAMKDLIELLSKYAAFHGDFQILSAQTPTFSFPG